MQVMGVTGKIYGLKTGTNSNGKETASFRVGVRKQFVTDADKQNGTTMTFIPCAATGPTAKFIADYFNDGDGIAIGDMEYQTYRSKNADPNNNFDDAHIFRVNKVGFVGDNSNGGNGGGNAQGNARGGNNNQRPATNNQRQAPANNQRQAPQRQTVPADNNIGNDYQAQDDLPF